VQAIQSALRTYRTEVQHVVRDVLTGNLNTAYADSLLSVVPAETLDHAWDCSTAQCELFIAGAVQACRSSLQEKMAHVVPNFPGVAQLWVNMSTAALISNTAAMKASADGQAAISSGDKFYSKALSAVLAGGAVAGAGKGKTSSTDAVILKQLEAKVAHNEVMLDVINSITYCKVTVFKSECIKVNAVLSNAMEASIVFHIGRSGSAKSDPLQVQHVEVELHLTPEDAQDELPEALALQNAFTNAYFASIMCEEQIGGCFSEKALLAVEQPCHIPELIQKVR
jgi:hypothetical protein